MRTDLLVEAEKGFYMTGDVDASKICRSWQQGTVCKAVGVAG